MEWWRVTVGWRMRWVVKLGGEMEQIDCGEAKFSFAVPLFARLRLAYWDRSGRIRGYTCRSWAAGRVVRFCATLCGRAGFGWFVSIVSLGFFVILRRT